MERSIRKWVLWILFYNIKFKTRNINAIGFLFLTQHTTPLLYAFWCLTHAGYRRLKVRYPVHNQKFSITLQDVSNGQSWYGDLFKASWVSSRELQFRFRSTVQSLHDSSSLDQFPMHCGVELSKSRSTYREIELLNLFNFPNGQHQWYL